MRVIGWMGDVSEPARRHDLVSMMISSVAIFAVLMVLGSLRVEQRAAMAAPDVSVHGPIRITPDEGLQRVGAWAADTTGVSRRAGTYAMTPDEGLRRVGDWSRSDTHGAEAMSDMAVGIRVVDALRRVGSWTTMPER